MTTAKSDLRPGFRNKKFQQMLLFFYSSVWIYLAVSPLYRPEWWLENYLVFAFALYIVFSYKKLQLSDLSYLLLTIFMTLHAVGAHYGYSDVPIGNTIKELYGFARNPYDRALHFSFGLLFAYPVYEILKRYSSLKGAWLFILPVNFVVSLSAIYEMIEAVVAWTLPPEQYNPFVGLQGDMWDGFKDMLMALTGVIISTMLNLTVGRNDKKKLKKPD